MSRFNPAAVARLSFTYLRISAWGTGDAPILRVIGLAETLDGAVVEAS